MDYYSQPFSVLNERLRPQLSSGEQLYSSLSRVEGRQLYSGLSRVEGRQLHSLKSKPSPYRATVLPAEPKVTVTVTEDPVEPKDSGNEDLLSDDLLNNSCLLFAQLNLKDFGEEELPDENRSTSSSEEKENPGELISEGTGGSSESATLDGGQRSYINRMLPDLINSGRPLCRRRTVGHVSDTLKEVRREVELSRKRSIRLKAQVDKLQEDRDGPGWSQHRETVTEEVLSVLRLLSPLTESAAPEARPGENRLDASLKQLQNVARQLAIGHTTQHKSGNGAEDRAVLQQALRDRDEAIEKKKAMEAELLRSKTEMMLLNNQLLEAVQKRLEMSLELETWKEDVQLILHQQLQIQQQAEQAQKKPSRLGLLRRNKPVQRPTTFPLPTSVPPTTNSNQIFIPKSTAPAPGTPPATGAQRNWRDKLRMTRSRPGDQDAAGQQPEDKCDGFQVVSLD